MRNWDYTDHVAELAELFVLGQDLFLTETARRADVVLPAATWGEKLGTFTNVDRTATFPRRPSTRRATPPRPRDLLGLRPPLLLTTGRTVYQFHIRTKTGRVPQLNAAAPDAWVEISAQDSARYDVAKGDLVELRSARGALRARARVCGIRPGVVFVPFHYGYWDTGDAAGPADTIGRAANELTLTGWDPVSKQPIFKVAAVSLTKIAAGDGTASPTIGGPAIRSPGARTCRSTSASCTRLGRTSQSPSGGRRGPR